MGQYLGICAKRGGGDRKTFYDLITLSTAANTIFNGFFVRDMTDIALSTTISVASTILGFALANAAHVRLNIDLSERNIGKTRGSKIVQRTQMAVCAVPIIACLLLNEDMVNGIRSDNQTDKEPIIHRLVPQEP